MNSPWEPGVSQAMQRHGGRNQSAPKVGAPKLQPDVKPSDRAMAVQDAPLVPDVSPDEKI